MLRYDRELVWVVRVVLVINCLLFGFSEVVRDCVLFKVSNFDLLIILQNNASVMPVFELAVVFE